MIRLAHFSDIHISAKPLGWRPADWISKRVPGWINFRICGRAFRFRNAEHVLERLFRDFHDRPPDRLIFSGDATALGFEAEFARAAQLMKVNGSALPGIAVPGNHDYYTRDVASLGLFEKYFQPWLQGERVGDATYPFAQRVGPVWLVAVNSCTGNVWAWDAGGTADPQQLERLRLLLGKLAPGPRILITHYPVCLANGQLENRVHGLRNLKDVVRVAEEGGVRLWVHGHRHGPYFHANTPYAPFPVICGGSATQTGLWSYHEYEIDGTALRATRRTYDPASDGFAANERFELRLD